MSELQFVRFVFYINHNEVLFYHFILDHPIIVTSVWLKPDQTISRADSRAGPAPIAQSVKQPSASAN